MQRAFDGWHATARYVHHFGWAVICMIRTMPRLLVLSSRLILWGCEGDEDVDRLLHTSLFKREWEAIALEMESFMARHVPDFFL